MTEPEESSAVVRGREVEAEPKSDHFTLRRNRVWPLFVVALVLAGAAVAVVLWVRARPDPYKVLVAIELRGNWWEGSKPAAVLTDQLGGGLKSLGFEPVQSGDPEVEAVLSKRSLEDAASKLHAGFVVSGSLVPQITEHEIEGTKLFEVTAAGQIQVRYGSSARATVRSFDVETSGSGATLEEALAGLVERAGKVIFDRLVPELMAHPTIEALLRDGDVDAVTRLKAARSFLDTRTRRLREVRAKYEKIAQSRAELTEGARAIHWDGAFDRDDELVALRARTLVLEAPVDPYFDPHDREIAFHQQLEALGWWSGGTRAEVAWRGYHLVHATASAQGNLLALVEDLHGHGRRLTVVNTDLRHNQLRVASKTRWDQLRLSADGGLLAMYERACVDCRAEVSVISTQDGSSRYRRPRPRDYPLDAPRGPAQEDYFGLEWLDNHQLLVVVHDNRPAAVQRGEDEGDPPDVAPPVELRVVDLSSAPPLERLITQIDRDERCTGPAASPDGSRVAMTCGNLLTFFDTKTGEVTKTSEVGSGVSWSADGQAIVYTRHGDVFLMRLAPPAAPAPPRVERLTQNDAPETHAQFSADGRRVYFESQANDPNVEGRIVSVIAWVEL